MSKTQTPDALPPPALRLDGLTPDAVRARLAQSPQAAAQVLRAGAEAGVTSAQVMYGQALRDGHGVAADPVQGFRWFLTAARAGDPMGMNMAGRCYDKGWGVAADADQAARWFKGSAEAGLDWGMYNYAHALRVGAGVEQDEAAALAWFEQAAALGHAKSVNFVGVFFEQARGVPQDLSKALDCYQRAAEGGDFRGQFNLARLRAEAGAVDEALAWLNKANNTSTPAFRETMRDYLAVSPLPALRAGASAL